MDVYKSEKEQWEDVKRWFRENGAWIVAGVVLGAGGLYGYRYWQAREDSQSIEAHVHYGNVLNALYAGKKDEALKEIALLDDEYGRTPYADQARLRLAAWFVDSGKLSDAVAPLTRIMDESRDDGLRLVARLRLARVLAEQGKPDEALRLIDGAGPSAFDPRFEETRGDILIVKGDRAGALAAYERAAASTVPAIVNDELLKLKIADLADVAKPAAAANVAKESSP
ncbi:MAG TPA: tetratricopeptide repeat protein [Steroidobacteraceae bacterium]|nr:tetratricopeptide repeat protein [Steroidobacteraceae bacterium]